MNIYVLTETENTDTSYVYVEAFTNLDEAKARLKNLYNESVVQGDIDSITESNIDDDQMFAYYENKDGIIVHWGIKETQLYTE